MWPLSFLVITLLGQYQVLSSPVFLWSNSKFPQSAVPLSRLSPLDVISNYICQIDSKQIELHLFAVNELINEDIHRGSQSNHQVFLNAKNDQSGYFYIPNVADDVYKTFSLIPQSTSMQCAHIQFRIKSSEIYETLHDALNAMQVSVDGVETDANQVVVMALISGPVIAQSLNRQRRDIENDEVDVLTSADSSCMFYADKLYWEDVDGREKSSGNYTLDMDKSTCTPDITVTGDGNITSVLLDLYWSNGTSDSVRVTLTANITGRYWYLEKATLDDAEYRYFAYGMHSRMDTPPAYSYVCTTASFVRYNSSTKYGTYDFQDKFYLTNLQFQPFYGSGSYFGPPNYCTSFFTSGIWMGITSSLLCLGILLFGVHRMMSIKSNDRFDDPKGKPLIIKAQE